MKAIFDMDGTLTCSTSIWDGVSEAYVRSLGYEVPSDYQQRIRGKSFSGAMEYIIERDGITGITADEMIAAQFEIVRQKYRAVPLKPSVQAYLEYLQQQGIEMAVATQSHDYMAAEILRGHGIERYFSHIVSAEAMGTHKSSPDVYLETARRLGAAPGECVVFEDMLFALTTAHNAGFRTVGVADEKSLGDRTAICRITERYITDFAQLIAEPLPR